ncbi:glycosyl hydrolase family 28-related protein [Paenibacillus validus]|uniref:glycosyl hydrolase family 28-related protein n=1 Tax=Paenibacillus validus TaxID=44253 RepID=UPI003D290E5A
MSSIEGIYNVIDFGADRSGAKDSTSSIQQAIHAALGAGGGSVYLPVGVYLISQTLVIDKANIGLVGNGFGSILRASTNLDFVIKITGNNVFGNRGASIRDFFIDCARKANNGMLIGSTPQGTVVGRYIHNVNISYALNWGIVIDAAQNNLFSLLDLEYNNGQMALLNGAGNNMFLKCEFNQSTNLPHLFIGSNPNFSGYNNNDFDNGPENNHFIGCVIERGSNTYPHNIKVEFGNNNHFDGCDIETTASRLAGIEIAAKVSFTQFNFCRFNGAKTNPNPAINNNGYRTTVSQTTFVNYSKLEIRTSNAIIMNNNTSNTNTGSVRIQNVAGNIAANIKDSSAPYYIDASSPDAFPSSPSQFIFNDKFLWFRSKESLNQILLTDNFTGSTVTTGTIHEVSLQLSSPGTWMIDVYSANGDFNHSRANTFLARFRNNSAFDLKTVQKMIADDALSGQLISSLNASVDEFGKVTLSVISQTSQTITTKYQAIKLNSY